MSPLPAQSLSTIEAEIFALVDLYRSALWQLLPMDWRPLEFQPSRVEDVGPPLPWTPSHVEASVTAFDLALRTLVERVRSQHHDRLVRELNKWRSL